MNDYITVMMLKQIRIQNKYKSLDIFCPDGRLREDACFRSVRMKTRQGNFSRDYIIRQSILNRPDATDPCPLSQWSGLRIVSILILP